jgi:predicted NodU family carbamoyl transferase
VIALGLNAFRRDSSAALVRDGQLIAAAEEERFRRTKHWAGFPSHAISYCLQQAGLTSGPEEHQNFNASVAVLQCCLAPERPDWPRTEGTFSDAKYTKERCKAAIETLFNWSVKAERQRLRRISLRVFSMVLSALQAQAPLRKRQSGGGMNWR